MAGEPTIYRKATDECVQGYGHAMMDSKCVGCGARNIFVVPVEPNYEAAAEVLEAWEGPSTANLRVATEIVDAALRIGGSG